MSNALRLDRKAKSALAVLIVVLLGLLALVMWRSIVAVTADSLVAAESPDRGDELIVIGGHSLLLKHGSVGVRIAHWVRAGNGDSRAFEVSNRLFDGQSAKITKEGMTRISAFEQLMDAAPLLKAKLFMTSRGQEQQMAELRMRRLRDELIARGIDASRISIAQEPISGGAALASSNSSEIVLVLSK